MMTTESMASCLPVSVQLNSRRIQRVLASATLDQAAKMGPLDKIVDWFNGGIKRSTIEALYTLYRSIIEPPEDGAAPLDILGRFNRLATMVEPNQLGRFQAEAEKNLDTSEWYYCLKVDSQPIFVSNPMIDSPRESYNEFQGAAAVGDLRRYWGAVSRDSYLEACVECMCDDKDDRARLRKSLSDLHYGRAHFLGVEDHPTDRALFIAKFTTGNLEFSDRAATRGEFRGQVLRTALETGNYANLGELCLSSRGTKGDIFLSGLVPAIRYNLVEQIGEHGVEELREFFRQWPIGKMNVAELLCRDAKPSDRGAPDLPPSALRV